MGITLKDIHHRLAEYYREREKLSETSEQVGWRDALAQECRFTQLLKVVEESSGFSINDLGCGHGDLVSFMAKTFRDFNYAGYDIFPSMISQAREFNGKDARSSYHLIEHPADMSMADYTVASGILNVKFHITDEDWLEYIKEIIRIMDSRSSRGFAFNVLTSYSDPKRMRPDLYYADPCVLFDFCKTNISRNVALLHDYQEYDFTIIVRKGTK
jgi:ubiquinone/menaquinone biosynthesis C-methylase UbiE